MFVGRAPELKLLVSSLESLPASIFVLGPPGIGKTSLCENVAEPARHAGALVVWGRAWELGGAPPFFPWLRVFTALAEGVDADRVPLSDVATQLREGTDDADARVRLALFEAARRALVRASSLRSIVIVLDDVHAADPGTLQLARYLQRELADARIALIFTARDAESEAATAPQRALLAELVRHATKTVRLAGLPETALDEWLPWFCGGARKNFRDRRHPSGDRCHRREIPGNCRALVALDPYRALLRVRPGPDRDAPCNDVTRPSNAFSMRSPEWRPEPRSEAHNKVLGA